MSSDSVAPEFPRQYVAPDADFGHWETAEGYFQELGGRVIDGREQLERWLIDWSELEACLEEEGTGRQVAWTCQTDDREREERYMHFVKNIAPKAKPWRDRLNRKFLAEASKLELPVKRYEVLLRSIRNSVELYREENIPLLVENEELGATYQAIIGAMTCQYDGREQTLDQMALYLEEPDRSVREEAWRLISDRYLQDADRLDELYSKMVAVRHRLAVNAGCDNFRTYAFRALERFDYRPEDCLALDDEIEKVVLPAVQELARQRMKKLGLDRLRPWDLEVDPEGRPPLRPFKTGAELAAGCLRVFQRCDPELGNIFDTLARRNLLDLETRKGKAPGGYQATFAQSRLPFIFMNAAGTESDARTLLHEGGHAFHTWACRHEPLLAYRSAPLEFSEVASMGMECLTLPHLAELFGEDAERAIRRFFEKIICFFPFMASVDAFQHYVYTHVQAGIEAWKDHWEALTKRFAPEADLSGLQRQVRQSWQRKLHIYVAPFYYIEYGIAQLGALQIWKNSLEDYPQAVAQYRYALSLGGSRPLPELFEAAGCRFDFSEATLRPLISAVMERIGPG